MQLAYPKRFATQIVWARIKKLEAILRIYEPTGHEWEIDIEMDIFPVCQVS